MVRKKLSQICLNVTLACLCALPLAAQSYRVQCPASTPAHPRPRCMHLSGGDGFVTMADAGPDALPTYIFGSGFRLAEGAKPMEPTTAAPRSDRMSPNRFEATTTSNQSG